MLDEKTKIFVTVCEMASVSKAASELYMTGSGITKAIRNLESEIGVKLIQYQRCGGRTLALMTNNGKVVYHYAKSMMHLETEMKTEIDQTIILLETE